MAHQLPRTIQTILIGAAQIIRNRGWCRGTLLDERGAVCLLSAIFVASTGKPAAAFYGEQDHDALTIAAWEVVEDLINARYGQRGESSLTIPGWNDLPARTVDDVLALLDDAAAVAAIA
jgi:hypothetical protein